MAVIAPAGGSGDAAFLGAKAAQLARLEAAAAALGAVIPPWFVVAPSHDRPLADQLTPRVIGEILRRLEALGPGPYAVRSSARDEDGPRRSFAGQFASYLDVPREQVAQRILDVWRSAASDRVAVYRGRKNNDARTPPSALVQRMVRADAAGIAFSVDPVGSDRRMAVVTAVDGLGDRLASGAVDGDLYAVARCGAMARTRIAGPAPVLREAEARAVARLARGLEQHLGQPQDIEWAIAGSPASLYLLQARPITTLAAQDDGDAALWDNSNIVESYSGVTTPLTFSFARRAYARVYEQLLTLLGVPREVIGGRSEVLAGLIGIIKGRIYYNLLNWYRMLALLPGFRILRRYMEDMMGVDRALAGEFLSAIDRERASVRRGSLPEFATVVRTLGGMIGARLRLRRSIARFNSRVDAALAACPTSSLTTQSLGVLSRSYRELERRLLAQWRAPLVNDLACMVAMGLFRRVLSRWADDSSGALANASLVGQGGMVSAEPARRIREMSALAAASPELMQILRTGPRAAALAAIAKHPALAKAYADYLERFGDRCLGELKLESATLADDPLPLLRAIGAGVAPPANAPLAAPSLFDRIGARPLRLVIAYLTWREARARIRDRENLRFQRTRVFGHVRRIVVEIGRRLAERDEIERADDVFYLQLEEILAAIDGTPVDLDLRAIVAARRAQFARHAQEPVPPRRFVTRGPVVLSRLHGADRPAHSGPDAHRRQGLGCCPGLVRGRARLVREPQTAVLAHGDVLVAEFTDPGWITLFAQAAGLIVERGSILSHSAIVAREMDIPTVVGVPDVMSWLNDGDMIELDGATGLVTKLAPQGARS